MGPWLSMLPSARCGSTTKSKLTPPLGSTVHPDTSHSQMNVPHSDMCPQSTGCPPTKQPFEPHSVVWLGWQLYASEPGCNGYDVWISHQPFQNSRGSMEKSSRRSVSF